MKIRQFVPLLIITSVSLLLWPCFSSALTLSDYLQQVQDQGLDAKEYQQETHAAHLEGREADLRFKPSLFFTTESTRDNALANPPLLTYEKFEADKYSLGVSEEFDFGLQAKLSYQMTHTNYVNSDLNAVSNLDFYDAKPVIELTMPLLQNGFGRTSRAQRDLLRAQSQANGLSSGAQAISLTIQAETTYWNLSAAKQAVEVQRQALKSAEGVKDYVTKKARMNLGEDSDVVQASALVEARQLQLQQAENEARSAAQTFNALRYVNSSEIPDAMDPILSSDVASLPLPSPTRPGSRLDVLAAEAQTRITSANSVVSEERNRPTFDVYGSYALNGRAPSVGAVANDTLYAGRPTGVAGVRFSMPLDIAAQSDARQGAKVRAMAAQTAYQVAAFNQDKDWSDLVRKIEENENNLKLATSVETIQDKKLNIEKKRLREGRTTTYQVLLFEQDLLDARLSKLRNAAQVLSLRSQIKVYQASPEGSHP
jgi:outer membrane protein TolC